MVKTYFTLGSALAGIFYFSIISLISYSTPGVVLTSLPTILITYIIFLLISVYYYEAIHTKVYEYKHHSENLKYIIGLFLLLSGMFAGILQSFVIYTFIDAINSNNLYQTSLYLFFPYSILAIVGYLILKGEAQVDKFLFNDLPYHIRIWKYFSNSFFILYFPFSYVIEKNHIGEVNVNLKIF